MFIDLSCQRNETREARGILDVRVLDDESIYCRECEPWELNEGRCMDVEWGELLKHDLRSFEKNSKK